jgi:hypothetical protein
VGALTWCRWLANFGEGPWLLPTTTLKHKPNTWIAVGHARYLALTTSNGQRPRLWETIDFRFLVSNIISSL